MSDNHKNALNKEDDDSGDESQLKIVEDEAPSQSGADQERHEETGTKSEMASPNLNNNNDLASPSTSSQKAGCSGMGKGPKTVQPNFDFDYDGPPVSVSNGMALELVNRFGLNNAWGAFLKLKGYHITDKNSPQPPEHVQALKRFRRKIRTVREMFNGLRDKNDDTDPLMSKEFVILLKSSNENGGESVKEEAGDDSTVDIPTASTSVDKKAKSKVKKEEVSTSVTQPITVQIDNAQPIDINISSNGAVPADPTHPKRPRKSNKKDTKRDSVIAATTSTSHPSNHVGSSPTVKTQSKIDEIVSGVIDRVMAANQKEQNKVGPEPATSTQMLPPTLGVEQLQELYRLNPSLFNSFNIQQSGAISNVQSLLSTVKTSTSLNPSVTTPLQLNTGPVTTNPAAKLLLHGLPGQQQPTFLDSQTAQLFFPPTQTPLNTPSIGAFGIQSPFLNTAAIRAALHQQSHMGPQVFPGGVTLHGPGPQLIPHWLGQLDPSVSLPQQLLAPVSSHQSVTSQKHSAHSVASTDKPLMINVQPTEESDDDEESEQKIDVTVSPMASKSSVKSNHKEELKAESVTTTRGRKPSKASTVLSATNSAKEEKATSPRRDSKQAKTSTSNHAAITPVSTASKKSQNETDTLIADLREQVEQLESQLNAERTKFSVQKRRMDMMRDKLKKKDDELQTARIDYACQKTDNGALRLQLETLRSENDEFRKRLKEPPASTSTFVDTPTTSRQTAISTQPSGRGGRTPGTRGRKAKVPPREPTKSPTPVEKEPTPVEEPQEPVKQQRKRKKKDAVKDAVKEVPTEAEKDEEEQDGRRQSKRLAGARSRVLYSAYS